MKVLVVSSDRSSEHSHAINLGDAWLTDALVRALHERGHVAEVVDFGGNRSGRGEPRTFARGFRQLLQAVRRSDAVLIGGGTLLQDDNASAPLGLGGLPRLCAATVAAARLTRTPTAFFAVGCDPVTRLGAKLLLRFAVRGTPIWVRDETSRIRVRDHLGGDARLAADAALLMDGESPPRRPDGPVVVALNSTHARELRKEEVSGLRTDGRELIFLNMSQGSGDLHDSSVLPAETLGTFDRVTRALDWVGALEVIRSASVVYASRMHALYMAVVLDRPMVAVSSLPKVMAFAEEFGVPLAPSSSVWRTSAPRRADPDVAARATVRVRAALDDVLEGFERPGARWQH